MDFNSFWSALASFWPLKMKALQAPIIMATTTNPVVIPGSGSVTAVVELPGDCDIQIDDWTCWSSANGWPDDFDFRFTCYYGNDWSINYPASNPVRGELIFGLGRQAGRIGYRPWWIETYGNRGLLQFNFSNIATTSTTIEIALRGHRRARSGVGV